MRKLNNKELWAPQILRDQAPVKSIGGAQEDHLTQASLGKLCRLAPSLFQLQIKCDGHLLNCLTFSFQAYQCRGGAFSSWPPTPPATVDWSRGKPLTLGMWNKDREPVQSLRWHWWDMFSSCGNILPSGLGSRQYYLSVRQETGVEVQRLGVHRQKWRASWSPYTIDWPWGPELYSCPRFHEMICPPSPYNKFPILHEPGPAGFSYL